MLQLFSMAYEEKTLRGDYRLAMLACSDCHGAAYPRTVSKWCNCSLEEASVIISDLHHLGWLEFGENPESGRVEYFNPQMVAVFVAELWPNGKREKGEKQWHASAAQRREIYDRDGHKCHYCGSQENLSLDHIIPRSKGGSDKSDNLLTCCKSCNSSKGVKSYEEFVEGLS